MKRHLMTVALMGFAGSLLLAGNAEACHKRKCTCAPSPAPCVVVESVPCPPPAPVCQPTCAPKKKCGMFACFKGKKMGCHKKVACAPAPCGEVIAYSAPVTYSAPGTYSTPQAPYSSPQASVQH